MNCHLIRWNPNTSSYKQEDFNSDFFNSKYFDGLEDFSWDLKNKEAIKKNDFWIVLRVGTKKNGIVALGNFVDRSDFGWYDNDDEEIVDLFMDVICMFNLDDYDLLSVEKLQKVCPNFDWNNKTNDNEIIDLEYTKLFFPLIAEVFTDSHGITPFYSYSTENHPEIDNEIQKYASIFCPNYEYEIVPWDYYISSEAEETPYVLQSYRLPESSILILKSNIGNILMKYWNYDKNNNSKGTDFIFKNNPKFSIISKVNDPYIKAVPAFTIVPEELEIFSKLFVKEYSEQEVNEVINDIIVITDKIITKDIRKNLHQIQIDIGIKFILKTSELLIEKKSYESNTVYTDFYQLDRGPSYSITLNNSFKVDDDEKIISIKRVEKSLKMNKESVIAEKKF